ncbi:MAG: helix-hairpin-helix domain-containing protein [Bacilli bacterium]|jgi:competence protein ComEA|nr:helix-hairpin-helix domain-containing protein [Bacilli bacterium]
MLKRNWLIIFLFAFGLFGCAPQENAPISFGEKPQNNNFLTVEVRGEVINPGLYMIKPGTMLFELIEICGGFSSRANIKDLTLVSEITQNQTITIPSQNPEQASKTAKINLNVATVNELMQLPGIGQAKAEAIVTYRNKNGGFRQIEEIMQVQGIGQAIFNTIKTFITI